MLPPHTFPQDFSWRGIISWDQNVSLNIYFYFTLIYRQMEHGNSKLLLCYGLNIATFHNLTVQGNAILSHTSSPELLVFLSNLCIVAVLCFMD